MNRAGTSDAGRFLRELLLRPPYRRRWEQFAERRRPGEINNAAVARVLAEHLWDAPRRPGDDEILPNQLRDTVARALSGRLLSRRTLTLFIDAFQLAEADADRAWRLWEGSDRLAVLVGPRSVAPEAAAALAPTGHRTLTLHEHHRLGEGGLPTMHHTIQTIEATVDGLDRYPYRFDTDALTVEVGRGCKGLTGPLYQVTPELYAVDIALSRPLALGETTTIEYWTYFRYSTPPAPEFRRAALRRIRNVDLAVEFHPQRLPRRIWWAVWDGLDSDISEANEVTPDGTHTVQRYLEALESSVVGFRWEW